MRATARTQAPRVGSSDIDLGRGRGGVADRVPDECQVAPERRERHRPVFEAKRGHLPDQGVRELLALKQDGEHCPPPRIDKGQLIKKQRAQEEFHLDQEASDRPLQGDALKLRPAHAGNVPS